MRHPDLTAGDRFERLVVTRPAPMRTGSAHRYWWCLCVCGRETIHAGTVAELPGLCDTRGFYPYCYVRLAEGSYICVNPFELEVLSGGRS